MTVYGPFRLVNRFQIIAALLMLPALPGAFAIPVTSLPDQPPLAPLTTFKMDTATVADPRLLKALNTLNQGDAAGAIVQVRNYLEAHPGSASAHELLGAALAIDGKTEQALTELRRAVQINPKQSTAYTKIGDIYMSQGLYDRARPEFEKSRKINPADRLNYQRLGYLDELAGNTQSAIANYERGIKGMPSETVGVKLSLASLYNSTGAFTRAVALLEPLVSRDYKDPAAQLVLGSSYLGLGRTDEAVERYKLARTFKGDEARVSLALGIAYREQGEFKSSLKELDRVVRAAPDWSTALYQYGETSRMMQQYDKALSAYRKAGKLNPDSMLVRQRIGEMLFILGRHDEAVDVYSALLSETNPASPAYLALLDALAAGYRDQGMMDKAESTYRRMIEDYPKSGYGYSKLGSFYGYQQRYDDAIRIYRKGLNAVPEDAVLIKDLSVAYSRKGKHRQAVATAKKLVELNPDDVQAIAYTAALQEDAGNRAEAERGYEKVLSKDPENVLALNNLAMLRTNQGDHNTALELANRARKLVPNNAVVMDTYGWILYRKGSAAKAAPVLEQAVELAPRSPTIHYHYGVVSQALNDNSTARASFTRALDLSTDFTEAADAKARLARLGG